jgi:hypothetical protein
MGVYRRILGARCAPHRSWRASKLVPRRAVPCCRARGRSEPGRGRVVAAGKRWTPDTSDTDHIRLRAGTGMVARRPLDRLLNGSRRLPGHLRHAGLRRSPSCDHPQPTRRWQLRASMATATAGTGQPPSALIPVSASDRPTVLLIALVARSRLHADSRVTPAFVLARHSRDRAGVATCVQTTQLRAGRPDRPKRRAPCLG